MSIEIVSSSCDCCSGVTRRNFIKSSVGSAAALAAGGFTWLGSTGPSLADSNTSPKSETLVTTLYQSLSEEQRMEIVFPFDHPLRSKIDNNWQITDKKVASFFTKDQQAIIRDIFNSLHSPEYAERVLKQVEQDGEKEGFGGCSVALFGQPGTGKFEFVLTGRHVTRRCDGDSVSGAAFGGPIFYGHAAGGFNEKKDHPGNAYWFQAVRANEVFQIFDGKQRAQALLAEGRDEKGSDTVKLTGERVGLPGIPVRDLTRDQKDHVRKVLADLLAPFRKADADEAMKLIERNGFDDLHLAFYKNHDIGNDGIWDVWQIEGPSMLWYFRGEPHVHTWVHIRDRVG